MLGILPKPAVPPRKADVGAHTIISIQEHDGLQPLCVDPACDPVNSMQLEQKKFKIRLTRDTEHSNSANLLIRKMYSWRGYDTHMNTVSHAPNSVCLSVFSGDHAIGTLTLGIDSPEGLKASNLYPCEIEQLRSQGRVSRGYLGIEVHELDPDLDLRLVAGPVRARRHDRGVVVGGEVRVGPVDRRFVEAGLGDACLQVVGNKLAGHAAEEGQKSYSRTA